MFSFCKEIRPGHELGEWARYKNVTDLRQLKETREAGESLVKSLPTEILRVL